MICRIIISDYISDLESVAYLRDGLVRIHHFEDFMMVQNVVDSVAGQFVAVRIEIYIFAGRHETEALQGDHRECDTCALRLAGCDRRCHPFVFLIFRPFELVAHGIEPRLSERDPLDYPHFRETSLHGFFIAIPSCMVPRSAVFQIEPVLTASDLVFGECYIMAGCRKDFSVRSFSATEEQHTDAFALIQLLPGVGHWIIVVDPYDLFVTDMLQRFGDAFPSCALSGDSEALIDHPLAKILRSPA